MIMIRQDLRVLEKFTVEIVNGFDFAFVGDHDGFLDKNEMKSLIGLLDNTLAEMERHGKDQPDILADCEQAKWADVLAPRNWRFPGGPIGYDLSGPLVYFVYSPKNNQVKIGHTNNLSSRLWGICRDCGEERHDLRILAVLDCANREKVESRIHDALRDSRIHGEWFSVDSALAFIEQHSGVKPAVQP